ncbi:putative sMC domain protein [Rickettsia endosymbiont of Ixodes pacificus]|uniref:hypothetical protein n=1 Tax=Rickettsia endosymbiont of Ixodes pacificus TaxID=1133329 RepID=UPI0005F87A98|nr:hypothetical protein [Rickettsia endosymbiont of Ixodes pacificus]KJW03098.1 putative sMC domain protein [Rickettsia endosymbiont of Ixodes pacificus]
MSREISLVIESLYSAITKYFSDDESNLSKIKEWFELNVRGDDQLIANRSKVSAIWLYKQLKQHKPNINIPDDIL